MQTAMATANSSVDSHHAAEIAGQSTTVALVSYNIGITMNSSINAVTPDLPRWIASSSCDSNAMFAAFSQYLHTCTTTESEAVKDLYTIEHAQRDFFILDGQLVVPQKINSSVPSRPCTTPYCARCEAFKGGYQFRWYSPKWDADYRKFRRPGSWCPGDSELLVCKTCTRTGVRNHFFSKHE